MADLVSLRLSMHFRSLSRSRATAYAVAAFLTLTAGVCPGPDDVTAPIVEPAPPPATLAPAPYRPVLFSSMRNSLAAHYGRAIFGMQPDGSGIVQISSPNGKGDDEPRHSPDGGRIVFVRSDTAQREHIAVMNADGSGVRLLTNAPNFDDTRPAWTPDGQRIVFARVEVFIDPALAIAQLYVINVDGSGLRRLSATITRAAGQPSVSPSGTEVAYQSSPYQQPSQIRVMSMDGSNDRSVAQNAGNGILRGPMWHPDGSRILFSGEASGGANADLFTVRPNATELVQLASTPGIDEQEPAYSPDGTAILYSAPAGAVGAGTDIYRVAATGGPATRLTTDAQFNDRPFWDRSTSTAPLVYRVVVSPKLDSVSMGQTLQLRGDRYTSDGTFVGGGTSVWRALNTYYATVSSTGMVTPVEPGLALIEVQNSGAFDTARVIVRIPLVYTLTITPARDTIDLGETRQLSAARRTSDGAAAPGGTTAWRALDAGVATVSASGLVSAVAPGSARIVAENGGVADTAIVVVRPPTVYVLAVTPKLDSITLAQTLQLSAARRTTAGVLTPGGTTTWQSLNAAIATVSGTGLVVPVAAGTARIVAQNGAAADTATVVVLAPVASGPVRLNLSATSRSTVKRLANNGTETIANVILVGDHEQTGDRTVQGYAQYSIAAIPAGATISSATLSVLMNASGVTGSPFTLGPLSVYQVAAIALTDTPPANGAQVTTALVSFTSVDVAALVRDARAAGRTTITFHFRFRDLVNGNGQMDALDMSVGGLEINFQP